MATFSARALASLLADWRTASPAYSALADRLRLLIVDGRIPVGSRLPAERELAETLGVSRTTVAACYAQLRDRGYLTSLRGSGSVARLPGRPPVQLDGGADGLLDLSKAAMPATPHLAEAAVRAAAELPTYLSGTGFDPVGLPALRQAIADRYARRGVPTSPDEVMVTVGAQHAIALLSRVLLERGDRALVESPSYPHAFEALRAAGARLVPVNVTTEHGWDADALEQGLRRTSPAVGYLMPDFHNPTGRTMDAELRERTLALASRQGTTIIADETMSELAIDELEAPLPLAAYGAAVSIGSLGKTVWGGVRIGWIRARPSLIQKLVRARLAIDLGTPILEQLIAVDLLGNYDEILRGRREQLRRGRDHLRALLAEALPDWTVPDVSGGVTLWVNLGRAVSSQLTLAARSEGLLLAAGPRFGIDGAFERYLRIPFTASEGDAERAVGALRRAWEASSRHPLSSDQELAHVV